MILQHSNATPIRCRGGIGYACCFCTEQFPDPADLKTHNLECHHNDKAEFVKGKMMSAFLVKLDITALKCTVCNKSIDTLEELVDHLIKSHNKKLYTDIKSHILPFKFDGVLLKCIYCLQIFSKFKLILEHMNTHFRNYVCEVCDAGYVSRKILDTHVQGHKLGVFQCEFCEKVFDTIRKKKSHEKSVHIHSNFLYKCGYCNVKFSSSSKKEDHITKIHGVEAPRLEFNCRSCGEIFDRKRRFMMHIQRDHLMERRYACELCDMKFFISCDLKQHMLKHTGIKEFQCDVCLKSYGRKNTLKEHMRIHADDRRFKCGICDRAFVQKCSWKNHMRSKHKELVVN